MKKLFISLCLFLAVSSVFAQNFVPAPNFVPDPTKVYNIVESTSGNVIGASGNQPALTTKVSSASQTFHFVPTGATDTYYLLSVNNKYLNKKGTSNWESNYEIAINGTNSEWVIVGADATGVRLKNNGNSSYLAADGTSDGSSLYTDKGVDNANGLYKLQEATVDNSIPTTVYYENFNTSWTANWTNDPWSGAPSTVAGKWFGGVDLQTTGDATMNLEQWWGSNGHILKINTTDASVLIPNINVTGFDSLKLSVDIRDAAQPIIDVMVGNGAWVSVATTAITETWNWATQVILLKDAGGNPISNISAISLRFSPLSASNAVYDNVKILGKVHSSGVTTSLSGASKDVFSVYPNPATNYIMTKNAQKVTILDLNGRLVKEALNSEKVDVSSLAKGAYIVKVDVAGSTKVGKLIKE